MLSVVIPLYNKAHTIERTLASVFVQSFDGYEIIIVDDGSTDNSLEVIKNVANGRQIRLIEQENRGVSCARNEGVRNASKPYIAFLDGDDEWLPDHLKNVAEAIKKHPDAGMFLTGRIQAHGDRRSKCIDGRFEGQIAEIDYFQNPHIYSHISATVVSRDAFERTNGFIAGMRANEDFAFLFECAMREKVVYIGTPTSVYWGGIEGQATTENRKRYSWGDGAKRYNHCRSVFNRVKNPPKLFPVFERYELRHGILVLLREDNYQYLSRFLDDLSEDVLNQFPSWERFLWREPWLNAFAKAYILMTKLIWRRRGFPRVNGCRTP